MRLPKASFISLNERSIEEFSLKMEETNCLVMSEIAAMIASGFPDAEVVGKSPLLLESSSTISFNFRILSC